MIILLILTVFAVIIVLITTTNKKNVKLLIKKEPGFKDAKSFNGAMGKLIIAESGHIAFISNLEKEPRIIHINDISGFEIVTNEKNKLYLGVSDAGGLLFGGTSSIVIALGMKKHVISSICLDFKLNDWEKPSFQFYLLITKTKSNSFIAKQMLQSAGQICNLLEQLELKYKEPVNV